MTSIYCVDDLSIPSNAVKYQGQRDALLTGRQPALRPPLTKADHPFPTPGESEFDAPQR